MAKGNYLVRGDKTTCGGVITEGCEDHCLFGKAIAREGDKATCGQHPGMYNIVGGIANDSVHGRRMAGTLDSYSSCPCRARFIASMVDDTYEKTSGTQNKSSLSLNEVVSPKVDNEISEQHLEKKEEKEKKYTAEIILLTSTIIEKRTMIEVLGDHSAIYFDIENDPSGPYLFDPNGSYNPYKEIEDGHGQRGSGFLFSGQFANLDKFIAYQENPEGLAKEKIGDEWFPYKVKTLSIPVTDDEIMIVKNAAYSLDDGDQEPGALSCAEWSSKLLQYIEPDLDTYTLPNSLWEAVVEIKSRRIKERDVAR